MINCFKTSHLSKRAHALPSPETIQSECQAEQLSSQTCCSTWLEKKSFWQGKSNQCKSNGFGGCLFFRKGMHSWLSLSSNINTRIMAPTATSGMKKCILRHFKTLYALREKLFGQKEERKKKKQDKGKTGKIHPNQSMTGTQRKPSLYPPIPVPSWEG